MTTTMTTSDYSFDHALMNVALACLIEGDDAATHRHRFQAHRALNLADLIADDGGVVETDADVRTLAMQHLHVFDALIDACPEFATVPALPLLPQHTPSTPDHIARIDRLFADLQPLVISLAGRWADESRYEDITEYAAVIRPKLPAGFQLVAMSKRPFGFTFTIDCSPALYAITCTMRLYAWKRIR